MAFYRAGLITLAAFTLLIAAEIGLMADPDALALGGGDLLGEGFALD